MDMPAKRRKKQSTPARTAAVRGTQDRKPYTALKVPSEASEGTIPDPGNKSNKTPLQGVMRQQARPNESVTGVSGVSKAIRSPIKGHEALGGAVVTADWKETPIQSAIKNLKRDPVVTVYSHQKP